MTLTPTEAESAVWIRVAKELEARLVVLREQNEGDRLHDETMKIRGRIAEIKLILGWANPDPQIKFEQ